MAELPAYARNFMAASSFEATYRTDQGEQTLILEVRRTPDQGLLLFTVVDGQPVRVNSIHSFILTHPACRALSIPHTVGVLWNGTHKRAEFLEVYAPAPDPDPTYRVSIEAALTIEGTTYKSEACATLSEAMAELRDAIGPETDWWLLTCYHCDFQQPAFRFLVDDRDEMRCYRDAPEALFVEAKRRGKGASDEALYAGHYYVNAFHTCAAWRRRNPLPTQE
jgi:hypothetical protein